MGFTKLEACQIWLMGCILPTPGIKCNSGSVCLQQYEDELHERGTFWATTVFGVSFPNRDSVEPHWAGGILPGEVHWQEWQSPQPGVSQGEGEMGLSVKSRDLE